MAAAIPITAKVLVREVSRTNPSSFELADSALASVPIFARSPLESVRNAHLRGSQVGVMNHTSLFERPVWNKQARQFLDGWPF
jgi:hypothetical protein